MKYTVSIEIDQPRQRVAQLLADPAQVPKWLRGVVVHEPLDGTHGQVGATRWESENEYRFRALPMRLLAPLLRGTFRKQSLRHMQDFKAFAEHGTDVRDAAD